MMGLVAVAVEGVGIVGNFGVGRKLGWECCGDKMWLAESCGE